MQLGIRTNPSNPWILQEKEFNSQHLEKLEAVMCQGNGYMGVRATTEEHYVGETRDTLIAGTFDRFNGEVNELPNLPDVTEIEIEINGQVLDLNQGHVSDYLREINLKNGLLTRSFTWTVAEHSYRLKFERLVSLANRHLVISRVNITPLDGQAVVKVKSGINGQQTNNGSQHLIEGDKCLFDGTFMQMLTSTNESKINMAITTCHKFNTADNHVIKQQMKIGRRQVFFKFTDIIASRATLQFTKYSTLVTDRDNDFQGGNLSALRQFGLAMLKIESTKIFDEQLAATTTAWQQLVWNYGKLQIESSDADDQVALNFARYQLAVSTPAHDHRMNIGAKGLTGEGYKGHTFWDTEIFILPYYIFTKPKVAKSLIEYRYLGLTGAHRKAQDNNYEGAQFPWEASWPSDGESTPVWGAADVITGRAMKIWSGFIEQHITSDVAYGAMEYINATGDDQFALDKVYEIVLDAAKFWASRLEYNEKADRYEINDVIGPDEYKEHINNNAFTNYTAKWTLQTAIDLYKALKTNEPRKFSELNQKLDLDLCYQLWQERVNKIYLLQPNADGVIPENDTYLSLKTIDLSKYKSATHVGGIFNDYNLDQISNIQVTKQADVLLLLYLFEQKFAAKDKRTNWNYYEPKTTHDSSLSLSTHAVLASDLKMPDKAYELFQRACQIDIGPDMASSNDGTHSASLGGIWNVVVFGFGGIRLLGKTLRIEPHLPKVWTKLSFEIFWQQQRLQVTINKRHLSVKTLNATESVSFEHRGQQYRLSENESVIIGL
ncbi:glycoside hydrolase family 65 protein [Lactiplantibacillus plantarum]|nr:glycosyl hydrolase family 65 protein [Lactiplantibacillus plantarum]MCG0593321.1 glycoside hydrolase family 65 protein [Lactiplantibacillus plantarum]MCG0665653.1 glycoside hydrolase family 65 protein [Lactiplantibacillus plantarum]MCG0671845.1 glycoside hydrolase family 65 protein [Lactiplantibacillus plantarum]MCG0813678.1 glycoside hydrolase family 65 protein [Lactiplantibacillus plantarum]MCG0872747.1 glycoside hydrolase family 65 protein [Lactiplantibacillus plantarum]